MNYKWLPASVETWPRVRKTTNAITTHAITTNALISFILFIACFVLARFPNISRPMVRWINSFAGKSTFMDNAVTDLAFYFIFSGVLLCGILFAYWISSRDADVRSRIFVGIFASFGAGVISRYLQHHLSTNVRPYFDSAVAFQLPHGMTIQPFNPWDSFPSDHSTVFAGLVVVLFVIKSRIRYPVAVWIAIVESSRIFIGEHFPLDLMGGACLASTVVWIFQYPPFIRFGEWCCAWEFRTPISFYTIFFIFLYEVSTLFVDVRGMAHALTGGLQ